MCLPLQPLRAGTRPPALPAGMWTRDMKQRTNLQQPRINKILKVLEERLLVKSVKSVQNASRKVGCLLLWVGGVRWGACGWVGGGRGRGLQRVTVAAGGWRRVPRAAGLVAAPRLTSTHPHPHPTHRVPMCAGLHAVRAGAGQGADGRALVRPRRV